MQAANELVARKTARLLKYLCKIVGNRADAEDRLQDVWVKVLYTKRERYTPGKPLDPWLFTLAMNVALDFLRKRGREQSRERGEDVEVAGDASTTGGQAMQSGRSQKIPETEVPDHREKQPLDAIVDEENEKQEDDKYRQFRAAVDRLSKREREAYELFYEQRLSYKEIAARMSNGHQDTEEAISSLLARVRKKFRKWFEGA
jgi:RNA polymerase sigma factor (sigma-70 family)